VTTQALADYAQRLTFEDLPPRVVDKAKHIILDTLGCALGGSQTELVRAIDRMIMEEGGRPICTLIGRSEKNSAAWCAFRNAAAVNALDFGDDNVYGHPGSTTVSTALAVAEEVGADGRALIAAVVAAYDIVARVGEAVNPSPERFAQVWGVGTHQVFGAAVAAARLMGLEGEDFLYALGLAGVSAPLPSGLCWNFEERPLSWHKDSVHWPAWAGVTAARLARAGFIGPRAVLDGPYGFWIMSGSDRFEPEVLSAGLGTDFKIMASSFKPYPACRWSHAALDAVGTLIRENAIDVADIAAVDIETFHLLEDYQFMDYAPANLVDAEFSLPYPVAMVLLRVPPGPDWYTLERMADPEVRRVASLVRLHSTDEMNRLYREENLEAARAIITTHAGDRYQAMVPVASGSPSNPLPEGALEGKFRRASQAVLRSDQIEALLGRLQHLEGEGNLAEVCELLRGG
jgi:2-methylcitrate dehydratase PrpD